MGKIDDALEWLDLAVLPQAAVLGCNPSFRRYCRCLDKRQAWTPLYDASQMC